MFARLYVEAGAAAVRRGIRAIASAMLLLRAGATRAEEPSPEPAPARPIAWQDTGPFAQLFLQLPFDAPEPVAPGALEVSVRTLYSNSIARESTADLSADVSVETVVPTVLLRYGLPAGFELQLALHGEVDYAGFLARPIKFVEGLFDNTNPLRAGPPPKAARFRVVRADGAGIDWRGSRGSAGDPWLGVKRRVRAQDEWKPAVSWRAALEIPAASLPLGSGLWEVGTGLVAGWTAGATSLLVETDLMIPQGRSVTAARLQTRPHFAVQLGLLRRLSGWLTAMLQASAHSSALSGTGLDVVDGTASYLLVGVGVEPSRSTSLSFALVENVLNPSRGADISAVLDVGWRR
ncbi:MAG TPA: hypothetical protein VF841_09740 [Anaeromyxobacter sp.]